MFISSSDVCEVFEFHKSKTKASNLEQTPYVTQHVERRIKSESGGELGKYGALIKSLAKITFC